MVPEAILRDTMFLKAANGDVQAFDKWMRLFGSEKKDDDDFASALNMTESEIEMIAKDAHNYWKNRGRAVTEPVAEPAFQPAF